MLESTINKTMLKSMSLPQFSRLTKSKVVTLFNVTTIKVVPRLRTYSPFNRSKRCERKGNVIN